MSADTSSLAAALPDGMVITDPDILAGYRQDRALDPSTLTTRWQDGARRFDDLDRRVWAAANEETKPARVADLNALSDALLRLRDAVDTEVGLRTSGVDQPGLWDAAQTVADARDELRRQVNTRTR